MCVRVEVLGGLRVSANGKEIPEIAAQPARASVLVLTALRGEITREEALGLLWPDRDQAKARHALNQNIHRLRGTLGPKWILVEGERLRVPPDIWVDAREFERLAREERYPEAGELYRGPLLQGWFLGNGSPAFQHWVDGERARLGRLHRKVQRAHLGEMLEAGGLDEALHVAQRWVQLSPMEDEAQHALIDLLARSGSRDESLAQFTVYSELLRTEGLEPLEETKALVEQIRKAGLVENGRLQVNGSGKKDPSSPPPSPPQSLQPPSPREEGDRTPLFQSTGLRLVGLALLALILIGGGGFLRGQFAERGAPPSTEVTREGPIPRVVVADFTSTATSHQLATVATEILRVDLQQQLGFAVLGSLEIVEALGRMRRDPTLPLHPPEALELAEREGVDLVVEGGIGQAAGSLVLTARILDPATREVTDAVRVIAEDEDDFINALGQLSQQLTEVIGSGYSFRPRGPGLEQVTTSSLEALRKYSLAQRVWAAEGDALQATALLREAVEIDSQFAMAYRRLAAILHATGVGRQERVLALRQAFLNSQRLPEVERLFTEGTYHLGATGDLDAAARAFRSLLVARPGDPQALNNLSLIYLYQSDWAEAISAGESCVEEETPAFPHCHLNLALAYFLDGEPGKADETLREALNRFPHNPQLVLSQLQFAAARREWQRADSLARVLEERDQPSWFWRGEAGLAVAQLHAARGRVRQAERKLEEVERLATEDSVAEDLTEALLAHAGLRLHVLGDTAASVEIVRRASRHPLIFNLPPLEFPYHGLAEAFLLAGRFQEAGRLMDRFFQEVPEENQGLFRGECLRLQALVALRTGQYEKAREDLDRARLGNAEPLASLQHLPLLEESQGDPEAALEAYLTYLESPQGNRLRYDALVLGSYLERTVELQLSLGDTLSATRILHELESLWSEADPPLLDRVQSLGLRFHGSDFLIDLGPRLAFLLLS